MEIKFYGAAGCVTGSCHILKVGNKKILLDCGLFQGKDEKEIGNEGFNFLPEEIDIVLLSHAHIDHSGRIPLLYKHGFKGNVYCTEGTYDLCKIMLADSGHIMEAEAEWKNRKRARQGLKELEPLYTSQIALDALKIFKAYPYDEIVNVCTGLKVRFRDAGHLLGSALMELFITENEKESKLVFTGDLGNKNISIIRDPEIIKETDYLIMETTYGDRLHTDIKVELKELVNIIRDTFKRGGNVIIPSFAVGRTQEVLYALNKYVSNKELKDIKVFVDSPLATESTKIFEKYSDYYDEEARGLVTLGKNPLQFQGLFFTHSAEESKALNEIKSGSIIISASGMCEAGRIRHHLKHNLWREECSIVFVGYQAEGTLGRILLQGAKKVKLFGEEIEVKAKLYNLHGLSGHADRNGLMEWLESFDRKPKGIFLVHGDTKAQISFKTLLDSKGYTSSIMKINDSVTEEGLFAFKNTQIPNESKPKDIKKEIYKLLEGIKDVDSYDKERLLDDLKELIYK